MSDENIKIVRALWHAFDIADIETLRALHAPGFAWHLLAPAPGQESGVEDQVRASLMTKSMFSEYEHIIDHIFGQGDYVSMISRGGGPLIHAPDAEIKRTTAMTIHRVSNGQVHEIWAMPDLVGFLLNNGAIELSPMARQLIGIDNGVVDWSPLAEQAS